MLPAQVECYHFLQTPQVHSEQICLTNRQQYVTYVVQMNKNKMNVSLVKSQYKCQLVNRYVPVHVYHFLRISISC